MSSNEDDRIDEEEGSSRLHGNKKRKIQRACDICRRKKIRCDGSQTEDNRCSNCTACGFDCTYVEAAKKRGPSKGYVESLEGKIERMEEIIRRLCPDEDAFNTAMASVDSKLPMTNAEHSALSVIALQTKKPDAPTILDSLTHAIRGGSPDTIPDDEDEKTAYIISEKMKTMCIEPSEYRFFGKSSGALLIQRAIEARSNFIGGDLKNLAPIMSKFRPKFWSLNEWEKKPFLFPPKNPFEFPEDDLLSSLVSLYFKHINLSLPLFHRPTFEKDLANALHHQDTSFALIVLLVCAVGSRFSDDTRVRVAADEPHSAGWQWFDQAVAVHKTFLAPHNLFDLQFYPVAVQFLSASAVPQSCWSLIGIGLRVAIDIGAHRRGMPQAPSADQELRKRAFWVLLVLDRLFGSSLGRPCGVHEEDYDLDFPIDCDDEYWENEDPHKRFVQPPGKPSKISAFIALLKLIRILSVTLRTIYAINKSKVLFGFAGMNWEQPVIAELDSALNAWIEALPKHLRWDPKQKDEDLYNLSMGLYANYYNTRIIIHRPFIPTPSRPSPLSFPSLAICTSAARSCSHLVDLKRTKSTIPLVMLHGAVCTSALVLLLNLWSGKRSGIAQEVVNKDMEDVHKCMEVLKHSEDRFHAAGRLWDILRLLADAGDFPLPERLSKKRTRRTASTTEHEQEQVVDPCSKLQPRRAIAGSGRVLRDMSKRSPQPRQPIANSVSPDEPSPPSSFSGSEVDVLRDQSSAFSTPASHSEPLNSGYPTTPNMPQLDPYAVNSVHDSAGQFGLSNWLSFDVPYPSSSKTNINPTPYSSSLPPSTATTQMPMFTIDPSAMSSTMFDMNDRSNPVGMESQSFTSPLQSSSFNAPLDGMYASPMTLATGGGGIDPFFSMQHSLPDTLNAGLGSDMMDMPVWSNSPAGMLFQEFAPYLAQIGAPSQQQSQAQQSQGAQF